MTLVRVSVCVRVAVKDMLWINIIHREGWKERGQEGFVDGRRGSEERGEEIWEKDKYSVEGLLSGATV